MIKRDNDRPRLFVLDTNVLMHDPTALFRFHEHDIYLPMVVLEELDKGKNGTSETARNVRQVSRFLDGLMSGADKEKIAAGLPLAPVTENSGAHITEANGRIFFQIAPLDLDLPASLPGGNLDNHTLGTAQALQKIHRDHTVVIVSKDINPRILGGGSGYPGGKLRQRSGTGRRLAALHGAGGAAGRLLDLPRQSHGVLARSRPHLLQEVAPNR